MTEGLILIDYAYIRKLNCSHITVMFATSGLSLLITLILDVIQQPKYWNEKMYSIKMQIIHSPIVEQVWIGCNCKRSLFCIIQFAFQENWCFLHVLSTQNIT